MKKVLEIEYCANSLNGKEKYSKIQKKNKWIDCVYYFPQNPKQLYSSFLSKKTKSWMNHLRLCVLVRVMWSEVIIPIRVPCKFCSCTYHLRFRALWIKASIIFYKLSLLTYSQCALIFHQVMCVSHRCQRLNFSMNTNAQPLWLNMQSSICFSFCAPPVFQHYGARAAVIPLLLYDKMTLKKDTLSWHLLARLYCVCLMGSNLTKKRA